MVLSTPGVLPLAQEIRKASSSTKAGKTPRPTSFMQPAIPSAIPAAQAHPRTYRRAVMSAIART